jgi:hypothetical protein
VDDPLAEIGAFVADEDRWPIVLATSWCLIGKPRERITSRIAISDPVVGALR